MRTGKQAVRAEEAVKVYGQGEAAVHALDGVYVDLAAGKFTAVMGPSGSGKSTFLHCAGRPGPAHERVGVCLGGTDISARLTEGAHDCSAVTTWASSSRLSTCCPRSRSTERHAAAASAGREADRGLARLPVRRGRPRRPAGTAGPAEMSGGEQQRVATRAPWSPGPTWCSPTSRPVPGLATGRRGSRPAAPDRRGARPDRCHGHPRPGAAAHADRVVFVADGAVAGELAEPTRDRILDSMRDLEA